jgi:hypothetical protein
MRAAAILIFLLLASPAHAADRWFGAPPDEYEHMDYMGELSIVRPHTTQEFKQLCTQFGATFACSRIWKPIATWAGRCQIVIVDDWLLQAARWSYEGALKHEMAHCNGWPEDHPGMRWVRQH